MLHVQQPVTKSYTDVRIKEEEQNAALVSPPAPDWVGTATEDASLDIDPELMESISIPTKRAKRTRKGDTVTKSASRKNAAPAPSPASLSSSTNTTDIDMKDEHTEEDDFTMPPQGPAFDFSQLQPGQTLAREQLLVLSTEDFDSYVLHVQASRDLTNEEKSEMKTIRRRIRNRESARESRSNKKDYVERLQSRVDTLKTHNKQLSLQIHGMQSENQALKDEVVYLQDMIKRTPALENLFNAFLYISTNSQGALDSSNLANNAAPSNSGNILSGGSSGTINVNSFLDTSNQE